MTPAFQRSLRELSAASSHLGQKSSNAPATKRVLDESMQTTRNFEASAQRLLAREGGGFDAARLGRSARQLELMISVSGTTTPAKQDGLSPQTPPTPYGVRSGLLGSTGIPLDEDGGIPLLGSPGAGGDVLSSSSQDVHVQDLEQYLKHHNDQIISSILTKQRQKTHQTAETLIRKRMERDFQRESESILRELAGYHVHDHNHDMDDIQLNVQQNFPNNATTQHAGNGVQTQSSQSSTSIAAAYGAGSKLSESARRHASIVATLNASSLHSIQPDTNKRVTQDLFNDLNKLANDLNSSFTSPANSAYLNSIKLLQSIHQHENIESISNTNKNTTSPDTIAKRRAEGTLSYLCHQFRVHVMDRVRTAALSGHTFQSTTRSPSISGFSKDILSFVELEMGLGLNQTTIASALLWPKLYFCLRCGDASAALQILQNTNSNESEQPLLLSLMEPLASYQSVNRISCLWDRSKSNKSQLAIPTNISTSLSQSLADVYQRARARTSLTLTSNSSSSMDNYKLAVLALLSLVETPQSILSLPGIVNTIEDYLYCTLWDAVQVSEPASTLPSSYGTSTSSYAKSTSNSTDSPSPSCSGKIKKLGKLVKHWGPDYFQADNDVSGWAYAIPLLASQQFQTAVVHLADMGSRRKNGLIHATHLGIALDFVKVDMIDLGQMEEKGDEDASSILLTNLLTSYSSTFQNVDPEATLEYLVRVPSLSGPGTSGMTVGNEARKQIIRLIVQTRSFALLAGSIAPDGSRTGTRASSFSSSRNRGGGALDAHFTASQVSSILAGAAEESGRNGNMRDAAELLALAGRFGDLLTLMNRELGSRLIFGDEQQNQEREFWRNISHQFYNAYLAQGRTHVQEILEAEDNMSLIATFKVLINLIEFFNRCADQNWEEAWLVIDQLQLIPQSDQDLSFRIESYRSMDESIKKSFHHVVLAGMECLYHQYRALKSNLFHDTSTSGALDQRLRELKHRGRIMVTFAGLIQTYDSGNIHSRISQMEVYMM